MSVTSNIELLKYAKRVGIPLHPIVSKDQLPRILTNGCYIINMQNDHTTDGEQLSGTHWVALYIEHNTPVYWDSFGLPPPTSIQMRVAHKIIYSTQQIQHIKDGYCGLFCIYFLWFMLNHKKIEINKRFYLFLQLWNHKDLHQNVERLKQYIISLH